MCGIAGTLSLSGPLAGGDEELVRAMTRALRHRGPDGEGLLSDGRACLGAARLKVTDLSDAAALPMAGAGSRVWLAYNGAVTNFRELRAELERAGKGPFRTGSDAEVALRLYEEEGDAFLSRLTGQFALCLYDRRQERALLARDWYGLRPLFYLEHAGRLHFASEIKALLEVPGWDRALDREALWHFFSLAYIPGDRTPFLRVRELPGGSLLEVDLRSGRASLRRYHELRYDADEALTEEAAARELRRRLRGALERSLAADVPAGLTLSGGVDTSALLALAKELGVSRRLHTFSIRIDEPSFDESRYQRAMVEFARPIHHEVAVRPSDVLECLLSTAAHLDEPSGDGAAVPTFLLAREARRHVKVLLSGEGGDELFCAYETHRAFGAREAYRRLAPDWLRRALRALAARLPSSYGKLSFDFLSKRFTAGAELGAPEAHLFWRHVLNEEDKRALLAFEPPQRPTAALFRELFDSLPFPDGLDRVAAIDLTYYFIDDLMVKNDRPAMAHSLETRFPYMERDVVELATRIPSGWKVKGLRGRRIQKLAMRDLLPAEILRRENMGLEMPHSLWLLRGLRPLAERYFSRERVERSGLLRHEAVERLWREHLAGRRDNGRPLWCILSFLVWFDLFVYDGDWRRHLTSRS